MAGIITPHVQVPIPDDATFFFLAGPIQYAPRWQDEAISYLLGKLPQAFIATPRTIHDTKLQDKILRGRHDNEQSQRPWENTLMRRALEGQNSCLLFWMAPPTDAENDGIGKMTRLELGETIAYLEMNHRFRLGLKLSVVFGGRKGFPYLETISIDLAEKAGIHELQPTLFDTCDTAIDMATR